MIKTTINQRLDQLSERVEEIAKAQKRLSNDREILEDILLRLGQLEAALKLNRSTQTDVAKDIRADISGVQDAVEAKVDEVTESMDDKTLIVKSPRESVIQKILKKIDRR
jgi:predicted transcriptional regulator